MSVGEEQTECPLCMEPLEMDDINFFPCTCGYQICRFCWHRIRTDENGLCPACRKQYPEDPAEFKPLTEDELQRIKKERRQKDLQRKQKAAENRKHLANVRVVQKNLVFVVGLSQRLADTEVLKKHEYFGKFGKIHKVVINQSTSYAGAQVGGPSASAYVTYHRPEDALRAIQAVNNVYVDGRTLKASLGTTKYCSHFLRGAQCPKPDCMYLHELGEEAASFTKEEMQQGKHQEYEQKLYEQFMNSQNLSNQQTTTNTSTAPTTTTATTSSKTTQPNSRKKNSSPTLLPEPDEVNQPPNTSNKEAWPSLGGSNNKNERLTNGNKAHSNVQLGTQKLETQNAQNRAPGHNRHRNTSGEDPQSSIKESNSTSPVNNGASIIQDTVPQISLNSDTRTHLQEKLQTQAIPNPIGSARKSFLESPTDHMSLFSSGNGFSGNNRNPKPPVQTANPADLSHPEIPDTLPVSSTTDWQAAFGFKPSGITPSIPPVTLPSIPVTNSVNSLSDAPDDDLGFDPWNESSKALADLIEKEGSSYSGMFENNVKNKVIGPSNRGFSIEQNNREINVPPPGFSTAQIGAFNLACPTGLTGGSKMMSLMQMSVAPNAHPNHTYHDVLSDIHLPKDTPNTQESGFNMKDWQDGLRALLPNINISFGAHPNNVKQRPTNQHPQHQTSHHNSWNGHTQADSSWDPAIVTSGHVTDNNTNTGVEDQPHWMASLHHLTEDTSNHRLPFVQQFQFRGQGTTWPPQTQHPPPGFHHQAPIRPPTETQKLTEGLQ